MNSILAATRNKKTQRRGHPTAADRKRVGTEDGQKGRANSTTQFTGRGTQAARELPATAHRGEETKRKLSIEAEQFQQELRDKANLIGHMRFR